MIVATALLMQSCILCVPEKDKTPVICKDCCEPVAGADFILVPYPKGVTNE